VGKRGSEEWLIINRRALADPFIAFQPPMVIVLDPFAFSFKNAIIILTSNLGSSAILDNMGTDMGQQDIKDMVMGYVSERGPYTRALLGWERIGACRLGVSCCFIQLGQLSSCCIPLEVKSIP
jgi:hypothetical protein